MSNKKEKVDNHAKRKQEKRRKRKTKQKEHRTLDQAIRVVKTSCAGLDVHKNVILATVCIFKNRKTMIPQFHQEQFTTFNDDLNRLAEWIKSYNCTDVYMESTGKYSTPVYNVLAKNGLHPYIVNPKYTRAIKGKKNDKKDSKWIAELACYDLLVESYIPEEKIRALRKISRRRTKLVQEAADEKRRIQNAMTESNMKLDFVFTDTAGISCLKVLELVLDKGEEATDQEILDCVNRKVKKRDQVPAAVKGLDITDDLHYIFRSALEHLAYLDNAIDSCEQKMAEICSDYQAFVDLLVTIPGINEISAMSIIAEIGVDMNQFQDVNHFTSWCGLVPGSNESAGKKKTSKISKGGKYLKPILVNCVWAAVFRSKNPYFVKFYNRIAARKPAKKALIATARKMITCIYYMFLNGEIFDPNQHSPADSTKSSHEKLTIDVAPLEGETKTEREVRVGQELIKRNLENMSENQKKELLELLMSDSADLAQSVPI